jgi:hypothetical protein
VHLTFSFDSKVTIEQWLNPGLLAVHVIKLPETAEGKYKITAVVRAEPKPLEFETDYTVSRHTKHALLWYLPTKTKFRWRVSPEQFAFQ